MPFGPSPSVLTDVVAAGEHLGGGTAEASRGPVGGGGSETEARPTKPHPNTKARQRQRYVDIPSLPLPRRAQFKGLLCGELPHQHASTSQSTNLFQQELDAGDVVL